MDRNIVIEDAIPEDAAGIRTVQRETWIATYPNPELGITKEDIESKVDHGHQRRTESQQDVYVKILPEIKMVKG